MVRLTKQQAEQHQAAEELVTLDRALTEDEKEFVLTHWQESSTARNSLDGAFFTPLGLARDLSTEIGHQPTRILDLGAGIGHLSYEARRHFGHRWNGEPPRELVCVERNADYVRVGQKVLPEATWIHADLFNPPKLGWFDVAISNPPFGRAAPPSATCAYRGTQRPYHVLELASHYAARGVVLLPQQLTPFRYSGRACFEEHVEPDYQQFHAESGLTLDINCGIDTMQYAAQWRGIRLGRNPGESALEIALCDFRQASPASLVDDGKQTQLALLP